MGNGDNNNNYIICKVTGLEQSKKPYSFGAKTCYQNMIAYYGGSKGSYNMTFVSNSKFTGPEFAEWRKKCEKDEQSIPNHDDIAVLEAKLKKARNHSYTDNEVNKIIEQNMDNLIEKGGPDLNVTYVRSQLEPQHAIAKKCYEENPSEESKSVLDKIESNLQKLNQIQKKRSEAQKKQSAVQSYNDLALK